MQITALDIYRGFDYVPGLSAVTNFVTLIAKAALYCTGRSSFANSEPTSFKAHVLNAGTCRCLALIFLPLISNLIFMVIDCQKKQQPEKISAPYLNVIKNPTTITKLFDDPATFHEWLKTLPKITCKLLVKNGTFLL